MLEGEISQIQLIERLVELWRESFTGAIRFESDGIIKIVYFKGGDILSASTNDRADSIDEILMRAGKVSREHVKQALAKRKENETLGDALLNLGFITRKELTWARRVQVVGVIRSIAAWESGSFTIVADYLPKRDEGTLFPLPMVLVELIVTDQDRQKFERAMDGGAAVFSKNADFEDVFRRLGLNDEAATIASQIDGSKSVAEVATASGGETFNVYKLLQALATLGILTRVAKPQEGPQFSLDDFASAGVADAADMWSEPEPVAQVAPTFELDEVELQRQPTMEFRLDPIPDETPTPEPQAVQHSAWDEEEAPEPVAAEERMPAWDTPVPSVAVPIPAAIEPPAEPAEEQWGFDEAQIETAARGAAPVTAAEAVKVRNPPMRKTQKTRSGWLPVLLLVLAFAGVAYAAFWWWQRQQELPSSEPVAVAPRPAPVPVQQTETAPPPAPVNTATVVQAIEKAADAVSETGGAVTIAPPPAPATTTATPKPMTVATAAPADEEQKPLPAVQASAPGRERYDAMAREFAANPSGNFTVQIQILCDPANLTKAVQAGGDKVWFVPQTIATRSCYRVFWGRYATRDEAQQALGGIPAGVRDPSAAVKAVPR